MTTPPASRTPTPRTPTRTAPVARPANPLSRMPRAVAPGSGGAGASRATTDVDISPESASTVGMGSSPQLMRKREKILIAGDSLAGKSYIWAHMADMEFRKDENWRHIDAIGDVAAYDEYIGPKFYVHDTDGGAPALIDPDEGEFPHLAFTVGGNVYPYPAYDWAASARACKAILSAVRPADWIFVDVVNRLYDQAQNDLAARRGFSLDNMIVSRGLTNKGFGAFEGNDWNLVKRIHDAVFQRYVQSANCNVAFLAHIRDLFDVPGRAAKREKLLLWEQVGIEPLGAESVGKLCDTICVIWGRRVLELDDKNNPIHSRSKTIRYIHVVKDRGKPFGLRYDYTGDFWDELRAIRGTGRKPENITAQEAEAEGLVESNFGVPPPEDPNAPDLEDGLDPLDLDDDSDPDVESDLDVPGVNAVDAQ